MFSTWEWADVWWRHFGAGRPLLIHVARDGGGRPVAILPLYLSSRRPARTLRFVGHGAGDQLGPVCAPGDRPAAAAALRDAVASLRVRWSVFLGDGMTGDVEWADALGGVVLKRDPSPYLRLEPGDWDAFLASRSQNFRQQARRRERKFVRETGGRVRTTTAPPELHADVDTLARLHVARWAAAGGGSGALSGARAAFHQDFARVALDRGWLRLLTLEAGDATPVASWYGFRFGGSDWYYQAGREPAWDRYAPGFILMVSALRDAIEAEQSAFRLLRGGEEYKDRFSDRDEGLVTVAIGRHRPARSALGVAARAGAGPWRRYASRLAG